MTEAGAMRGMSERAYARHIGKSRGSVQKLRAMGRLVLHADGSIDAAASDAHRRLALGRPRSPGQFGIDGEAVAVLHQHVASSLVVLRCIAFERVSPWKS